jgi:glycosyltransferase involved in cell wall biosynthesis
MCPLVIFGYSCVLLFCVDGQVKTSFPRNITFIKIKAPRIFPRLLRCLFLMLFKSAILASEIRNQGIDVLYILSGFWEQNIFLVASKIAKKPLVIRLRGDDWAVRQLGKRRRMNSLLMKIYDLIEDFALKHADHVISLSKFLERRAIEHGTQRENVTTCYPGINSDLFEPTFKKHVVKKFTLCCATRLVRGKGLEHLIKAVENLDVQVIILGRGEKNYIEKLKRKAQKNVRFLGNVKHEKVPEFINLSDVLVLPSLSEGLSRIVLEAMACAKPVITTRLPSTLEIGLKGWLIEPGDVDELRNAIIETSKTPWQVLEKMGEANREVILRKFNWNIAYEKIIQIVAEVMNKSSSDN